MATTETQWYRVVSPIPLSVDYENGHSAAFGYGMLFEASPSLKDIRRLTKLSPKKIVNVGRPETGGFAMPTKPSTMPPDRVPEQKNNLPTGVHDLVQSWSR